MKAYISRDTLIKLIRDHTVITKATDLPDNWQWFNTSDGILSWDFVMLDKVLVEVEPCPDWVNAPSPLSKDLEEK